MRSRLILTAVLTGLLPASAAMAQPFGAQSQIIHVAGDVYRANNGNWWSIFMVTPDGIIVGDPINVQFSSWLKAELDERFDVPVRYVVYSHSHWDHAEGGAAFADTAQFVAHENMLQNMDGRYPQMPGDMIDRNGNGLSIRKTSIFRPTPSRAFAACSTAFMHRSIGMVMASRRRPSCSGISCRPISSIQIDCSSNSAASGSN
jgi:glyoxylase-like metal-dependent hydrolase (beta-lactamase superfamily II)